MYVNQKFLDSINWVMLEIKLPREIMKSPFAMEVALASLAQGGGVGTWYARNFQGALVGYSSLEIASLEGTIHFYVRIQSKFRSLVEANLYAQYPGIEIFEAEDYTSLIRYHHLSNEVDTWGATYSLSRKWTPINEKKGEEYKDKKGEKIKMPADYLPIKTYVDYGLDKDPKEEFKTDPITPLLEFLGSLGKGEYGWYQVLVQDAGKFNDEDFPKTYLNQATHEHMNLADMANARKKQIRTSGYLTSKTPVYDEYGELKMRDLKDSDGKIIGKEQIKYKFEEAKAVSKKDPDLTQEEKDEIEMINQKLSKPVLRAVIRMMYVYRKEAFNGGNIQNIISIMRPFNHTKSTGNAFSPNPCDPYAYPWENTRGRRTPWRKEEMFEAYVEREGFFPHVGPRPGLDKFEDVWLWGSSMRTRKLLRMIIEAIMYPFDHPQATDVISLNTEELATLWHFPGTVAGTPTLPRIDSTKGVAPTNLPR